MISQVCPVTGEFAEEGEEVRGAREAVMGEIIIGLAEIFNFLMTKQDQQDGLSFI